jgi:dolichyl-diphosphooligosaccharide--protein glycosyltransferase
MDTASEGVASTGLVATMLQLGALAVIAHAAFDIRMFALRIYGLVIHEFDPWFNFRATQYLADHGMAKFFKWYDYMSWSPLGRPVGTTIYPGMQIISVAAWDLLNKFGYEISLNDVCCYVPVWGGVTATMLLGMMTYVVSGNRNASVFAAAIMAIIPAHLMRSVGGGFDNESVAISCLLLTFLLWCYSLSGPNDKIPWSGLLTGLAYISMVAAWGGYIFVLNLIGLHALFLILIGRFSDKLYYAYSFWYVVGTAGALQIPVVGLAPLKSFEQLGPMGVFFIMHVLKFCNSDFVLSKFKFRKDSLTDKQKRKVYLYVFGMAGVALSIVFAMLWPTGYFGPLSSRVRGLFVAHTRTGNPLVDSVAEHQPANAEAFFRFLHYTCNTAFMGFICVLYSTFIKSGNNGRSTDPMTFIIVYSSVTYFFSTKMNRLMLLMGPVSAILSGIAIEKAYQFAYSEISDMMDKKEDNVETLQATPSKNGKSSKKNTPTRITKTPKGHAKNSAYGVLEKNLNEIWVLPMTKFVRKAAALFTIYATVIYVPQFYGYCRMMGEGLSNPSIMFQARLQDGTEIMVDDYRDGYFFLRDNTPENARVMAWWDYGYQITGIGNRTTIADGNTWNHEHIALLGRALTSPEKKAHDIIKHMADYVLIWTGGGGDDLAKSPHLARIANSVFDDVCPNDPLCSNFGFYNKQMDPTPMMAESLLYKLHRYRSRQGVTVDPELFKLVYQSKYDKIRIYEVVGVSRKSKEYVENPANRVCDAPGSWHCTGTYPPALNKILKKKKDFQQLEDFNVKKDEKGEKYHAEYMKKMRGQREA